MRASSASFLERISRMNGGRNPGTQRLIGYARESSKDFAQQLRKNFRNLVQQVITVGALKFVNAGTIPALILVVVHYLAGCYWLHRGIEIRIEKECKRHAIMPCPVSHPVRCGQVAASSNAIQHISDIADKRVGYRVDIKPVGFDLHLQTAR